MKKKLFSLHLLAATFFANAQNAGIGVITPTAKLSFFANGIELTGTAFSPRYHSLKQVEIFWTDFIKNQFAKSLYLLPNKQPCESLQSSYFFSHRRY